MTPLEELQQQWQTLDQKLDRSLALETELLRQAILQPVRRRLNRLAIWPVIDIALAACVLLGCGDFLSRHWPEVRLSLCALVVMGGAIALLGSSIRQLERVYSLDWSGPVATLQESLARIRSCSIRQFQWVMLFSPLVGFCALMVGLQWLIDRVAVQNVVILDQVDTGWVIVNLIFGLLFVPAGALLAGVLSRRFQDRSWWREVLDGISGSTLKSVARDVEQWASLQQSTGGQSR